MKKRIAFVLAQATVGGVETSLINLLNKMDLQKYDICLFTNISGNPCVGAVPKEIRIIDLDKYSPSSVFKDRVKSGHIISAMRVFLAYLKSRCIKSDVLKVKCLCEAYNLSEEHFDCAIAYKQDYSSVAQTLYQIRATKKIVWIHGSLWKANNPDQAYLKMLGKFDKTYCVSKTVESSFCKICKRNDNQTEVLYNLLDTQLIIKKSLENPEKDIRAGMNSQSYLFATVGRLAKEKGLLLIPAVARLLCQDGYCFKWVLVGEGDLREELEQSIRKEGVCEKVILLGTADNPYPYMKLCDIYIHPSSVEGWGLTIQEAKILQKPIITTNIPVMREQIEHLTNGYLVDPDSVDSLYNGIKELIASTEMKNGFIHSLKEEKYVGEVQLKKLYSFLET